MRIALMLDTSAGTAAALQSMRSAVAACVDALAPDDEVIFVTTGRHVRIRVPPTTDRKKLKDSAATLFADGGGTVLMDGLLEIDNRFFKKAEDRWPVYVIFTSDGIECSAGGRENEFMKWALTLGARGISAHGLVLKTPKDPNVPKAIGLPEIVTDNMAQNTGGEYGVMNTTTGLPDKMRTLGEVLAHAHRNMGGWYALDIQTSPTGVKPMDISVARDRVRVQISDRRKGQ